MGRDASGVDGLARPTRRGQVRRAAAGTGPDPVSGSGDSGDRAEADFFIIKSYICPGSIAIGTKDLTHLSRIGCPGWKTGTKASSEPGLHAHSVVVCTSPWSLDHRQSFDSSNLANPSRPSLVVMSSTKASDIRLVPT